LFRLGSGPSGHGCAALGLLDQPTKSQQAGRAALFVKDKPAFLLSIMAEPQHFALGLPPAHWLRGWSRAAEGGRPKR